VNWRAVLSLALGIVVALLGTVVPSLRWLYDYAWFVGFAISGGAYVVLMSGPGRTKAKQGELIERNDPVR
jgi:NCS1 family nucleobase:cation symporter-1